MKGGNGGALQGGGEVSCEDEAPAGHAQGGEVGSTVAGSALALLAGYTSASDEDEEISKQETQMEYADDGGDAQKLGEQGCGAASSLQW